MCRCCVCVCVWVCECVCVWVCVCASSCAIFNSVIWVLVHELSIAWFCRGLLFQDCSKQICLDLRHFQNAAHAFVWHASKNTIQVSCGERFHWCRHCCFVFQERVTEFCVNSQLSMSCVWSTQVVQINKEGPHSRHEQNEDRVVDRSCCQLCCTNW